MASLSGGLVGLTLATLAGSITAALYFWHLNENLTTANQTIAHEVGRTKNALTEKTTEWTRAEAATDRLQAQLGRVALDRSRQVPEDNRALQVLWQAEALRVDGDNAERAALHRVRLRAHLDDLPGPPIYLGEAHAVQFSPDGRHACLHGRELRQGSSLVDLRTGRTLFNGRSNPPDDLRIDPESIRWFNADGSRWLACTAGKSLALFDVSKERILAGPFAAVCAWDSAGSRLAAADPDGTTLHVVDARDGRPLASAEVGSILQIRWSPDGEFLLVRGGVYGRVNAAPGECDRVLDSRTGEEVQRWERPSRALGFTPAGLVRVRTGGTFSQYSPSGEVTLAEPPRLRSLGDRHLLAGWPVTELADAFRHGAGLAPLRVPEASRTPVPEHVLWRVVDPLTGSLRGPEFSTVEFRSFPQESLQVGPDGRWWTRRRAMESTLNAHEMPTRPDDWLVIRDTDTGRVLSRPLVPPVGLVPLRLDVAPDGTRGLVTFVRPATDYSDPPGPGVVQLVGLPSLAPLSQTATLSSPGRRVAWPAGQTLPMVVDAGTRMSGGFNQAPQTRPARLHALHLGLQPKGRLPDLDVKSVEVAGSDLPVAIPADGRGVLFGFPDGSVRAWSADEGKIVPGWRLTHPGQVFALNLSPDGSRLSVHTASGVFAHDLARCPVPWSIFPRWDATTFSEVTLWRDPASDDVVCVSIEKDRRDVANPRYWLVCQEGRTGRVRWRTPIDRDSFERLEIDPTGRTLLRVGLPTEGAARVRLWDMSTGKPLPLPADPDPEPVRLLTAGQTAPPGTAHWVIYRTPYLGPESHRNLPGHSGLRPGVGLPSVPVGIRVNEYATWLVLGADGQVRTGPGWSSPLGLPAGGPGRTVHGLLTASGPVLPRDPRLRAATSEGNRLTVWDLHTGRPDGPEVPLDGPVRAVWLAGESCLAVQGEDGRVRIHDRLQPGRPVQVIEGDSAPLLVGSHQVIDARGIWRMTPTGGSLALATGPASGLLPSMHPAERFPRPARFAFTVPGDLFVSGLVLVFDDQTQIRYLAARPMTLPFATRHVALQMRRGAGVVQELDAVLASDGAKLVLFDARTGAPRGEPIALPGSLLNLTAQLGGGFTVITTTHRADWTAGALPAWRPLAIGRLKSVQSTSHAGSHSFLAEAEDGSFWMQEGGGARRLIDPLRSASFTADGRLLTETDLGRVRLIDPTGSRPDWHGLGTLPLVAEKSNRLVLFGPDNGLLIFDLTTGAEVARAPGGPKPWDERSLSPDGRKLLTLRIVPPERRMPGQAVFDGSCVGRVWDVSTGRALSEEIASPCQPFFAPESDRLIIAAGAERKTRAIDLASGTVAEAGSDVTPNWEWSAIRFDRNNLPMNEPKVVPSPNGRRVAVVETAGVRVYDRMTATSLTPPLGGSEQKHPPRFSPDGRFVVAVNRLWESATGQAVSPPLPLWQASARESLWLDERGLLIPLGVPGWRVRLYDLPFAGGDDAELIRRARRAAGQRVDDTLTLVPLKLGEFTGAAGDESDLAFHRREERLAQAAGDWPRVRVHLDRIRSIRPDDPGLSERIRGARLRELLAWIVSPRQEFRAAYEGYRALFRADPEAEKGELGAYNAACAALRLASGDDRTAPLFPHEPATLRGEAATWLEAELVRWSKTPDRNLLSATLRHWKQDADLASVQGAAIGKLPEGERARWLALWESVEAVLVKKP